MLTRTQIRTLARKLVSDTDATNPFWSDTDVNSLIENWQSDMASYLRTPRGEDSPETQVVDQYEYDLPTDWLSVIRLLQYDAAGHKSELKYKTEAEISEIDPIWRTAASGTPRYYFIANTITPGATLARKYNVYPKPDTARTMLMIYVKVPTAMADDAHVPVFSGPMHMLAIYYLAWFMSLTLNPENARYYEKMYKTERVRMCGEGRRESEKALFIRMK